jgi:hypothetical protein
MGEVEGSIPSPDMKTCRKHAHRSEESAQKCWAKSVSKKADLRIAKAPPVELRMRKYSPPKEILRGHIPMFIFQEDLNTEY